MTREDREICVAMVIDESVTLTLGELSHLSGVRAERIIAMIEEGILEPSGRNPRDWRFPAGSARRVTTVLRLQRDLATNLAGAALALELIEELDRLRERVRLLEHLVSEP